MRDSGDAQEAIARFADAWHRYRDADPGATHARARLAALGYVGDTPEELARWAEAHPAAERAAADALHAVIAAIERRPEDSPELRAALPAVAPYLGLTPEDALTVILHTLTAQLTTQWRGAAPWPRHGADA